MEHENQNIKIEQNSCQKKNWSIHHYFWGTSNRPAERLKIQENEKVSFTIDRLLFLCIWILLLDSGNRGCDSTEKQFEHAMPIMEAFELDDDYGLDGDQNR